jgi:hypothetical protein
MLMTYTLMLYLCAGNIDRDTAKEYADIINVTAKYYKLRPTLVAALIKRESRCIESAINSSSGAFGLMQIMPATGTDTLLNTRITRVKLLNQNIILDPQVNITIGAKLLRRLINKCKSEELAISAYNNRNCTKSDFANQVLEIEKDIIAHSAYVRPSP